MVPPPPVACRSRLSTLTRSVVAVCRSRTSTSVVPLVSPGTRLDANDQNATKRPSALMAASTERWSPAGGPGQQTDPAAPAAAPPGPTRPGAMDARAEGDRRHGPWATTDGWRRRGAWRPPGDDEPAAQARQNARPNARPTPASQPADRPPDSPSAGRGC